ncbi:hypothetical protein SFC65_27435 [Priestia filamentosa]|uniref:hypothetical protein n=1 Tax=Priestia filamentosa TaxID=1402861 RepID=UPI0039819FD3
MSVNIKEEIIFIAVGTLLVLFLFTWNPVGFSLSTSKGIMIGYCVLYAIYWLTIDINKIKKKRR